MVAAGALERVLKENDERRHKYLEAVSKSSPPRELSIDFEDSEGDSQANVTALIDALAGSDEASKCEELTLCTENATELPESLGRLTGLRLINLSGCCSLVSLPDSMSQLVALKMLVLMNCDSLVGTVELANSLVTTVESSVQVIAKPAGLTVKSKSEDGRHVGFILGDEGDTQANATALTEALASSAEASKCEELLLVTQKTTELPQSLGQLSGLKKLRLGGCRSLVSLPDSISQLVALKQLWLDGCDSLVGTVELRSGVIVFSKPVGLTVVVNLQKEKEMRAWSRTHRNKSESAQCAE